MLVATSNTTASWPYACLLPHQMSTSTSSSPPVIQLYKQGSASHLPRHGKQIKTTSTGRKQKKGRQQQEKIGQPLNAGSLVYISMHLFQASTPSSLSFTSLSLAGPSLLASFKHKLKEATLPFPAAARKHSSVVAVTTQLLQLGHPACSLVNCLDRPVKGRTEKLSCLRRRKERQWREGHRGGAMAALAKVVCL